MRTFARVDGGVVMELFPTPDYPKELIPDDGDIRALFHPEITWVETTDEEVKPAPGWKYSAGKFSEPEPYRKSPEETLSENKSVRDAMLDAATRLVNPLSDAVDAGVATDEERQSLSSLRSFRIEVNRVDLTQENPNWPAFPE